MKSAQHWLDEITPILVALDTQSGRPTTDVVKEGILGAFRRCQEDAIRAAKPEVKP